MKEVIGVRFRRNGKIYYFSPLNYVIEAGQHVIVETARGVEYGNVVLGTREIDETKLSAQIKPILRVANEKDAQIYEENREKSKKAYDICLEKITDHGFERLDHLAVLNLPGPDVDMPVLYAPGRLDDDILSHRDIHVLGVKIIDLTGVPEPDADYFSHINSPLSSPAEVQLSIQSWHWH